MQESREDEGQKEAETAGKRNDGGQGAEDGSENERRDSGRETADDFDGSRAAGISPTIRKTVEDVVAQGNDVQRESRQDVENRKHDNKVGNDDRVEGASAETWGIEPKTGVSSPVESDQLVCSGTKI